jgi:hypothetical protein
MIGLVNVALYSQRRYYGHELAPVSAGMTSAAAEASPLEEVPQCRAMRSRLCSDRMARINPRGYLRPSYPHRL